MKRMLIDLVRRWWWVVALTWLGCFAMAWENRPENWKLMGVWGLFSGPLLITFEQRKAASRVLACMPIGIRSAANVWYFVAVGIPFFAILTGGSLGSLAGAAWRGKTSLVWVQALPTAAFFALWMGAMTALMAELPFTQSADPGWKQQLVGLAWGASMGSTQIAAAGLPMRVADITPVWAMVFLALGAAAGLGWKHLPRLFQARGGGGGRGPVARPTTAPLPANSSPLQGDATGLRLMVRLWSMETLRMCGLVLLVSLGMTAFTAGRTPELSNLLKNTYASRDLGMSLFVGLAGTLGMTGSLRTWRALPLNSWHLTFVILLTAWLPMMGYWPLVTVINWTLGSHASPEVYWKLAILSASLMQVATVIGCLLDSMQSRILVLMLPAILLQTGAIARPEWLIGKLDWILGFGVPPVLAGTLWLLHWALTRRSNLYKPLPLPIPSR